jgi:hypothetical protein
MISKPGGFVTIEAFRVIPNVSEIQNYLSVAFGVHISGTDVSISKHVIYSERGENSMSDYVKTGCVFDQFLMYDQSEMIICRKIFTGKFCLA